MIPDLIIAGIVAVAIYLLVKLLVRLVVIVLGLGLLVYLTGSSDSINRLIDQVGGYLQVAFEYGTSVVEKLL